MKRILFIASLVLFFVSCEGPQGPPGRAGQDGVTNRVILDFEVTEWTMIVDNNDLFLRWEAYFDVDDLDEYIYNNAAIVAYKEDVYNDYKVQKSLPIVVNYEDRNSILWFQRIDFDYAISARGAGSVVFSVENSDFREDHPGSMWFRVVFMW